jgi:hypothetical protein
MRKSSRVWISILVVVFATVAASAQSFRVQCPTSTITHPDLSGSGINSTDSPYSGPTQLPFFTITTISVSGTTATATVAGTLPSLTSAVTATIQNVTPAGFNGTFPITIVPPNQFTYTLPASGLLYTSGGYVTSNTNGAIRCQQISGGDGLMTEADGTQTFMFSFGPLSGLADTAAGLPSTQFPTAFNTVWPGCAASGGVATATVTSTSGGTGYKVGDTISLTGGGGTGAVATVTAITGTGTTGPIATVTVFPAGNGYVAVTGNTTITGTGSGATFAVTLTNYCSTPLQRGDPATTDGATSGQVPWTSTNNPATNPLFTWNGAVGQVPEITTLVNVTDLVQGPFPTTTPTTTAPGCPNPATGSNTVTAWTDNPLGLPVGANVVISGVGSEGGTTTPPGYVGTWQITCVATSAAMSPNGFIQSAFQYADTNGGLPAYTGNDTAASAASQSATDGHVDPREIMDVGVMNGNIPAPLAAFNEDDEFFLTLSNVGMIQRPDLFEQHTVHFHGYPNASSFYDGVPDASIAINIGASFTYYYLAPDAGTYFWHCHITPPEHLQMGMVGQLHVRPRQDRVPPGGDLYTYLGYQNGISLPAGTVADLRTVCNPGRDILCSATMPSSGDTGVLQGSDLVGNPQKYTYNDGDASTAYDVEYPIQMHGFDPNFHFVGMTFNPELFADMKDKYFLLNGRSYPDTVGLCGAGSTTMGSNCVAGPQATITTDGAMHYSQPLPAVINIPAGGKALLRMVNLSVSEYHTLQSVGIPMKEVGLMAKLLRDQAGNNTEFYTNSITLGGGESLDVILDASDAGCIAFAGTGCAAALYPAGSTFYLYTPQLDHLSNDAENFGGMMTEVHICKSVVPTGALPSTGMTFGNTCN